MTAVGLEISKPVYTSTTATSTTASEQVHSTALPVIRRTTMYVTIDEGTNDRSATPYGSINGVFCVTGPKTKGKRNKDNAQQEVASVEAMLIDPNYKDAVFVIYWTAWLREKTEATLTPYDREFLFRMNALKVQHQDRVLYVGEMSHTAEDIFEEVSASYVEAHKDPKNNELRQMSPQNTKKAGGGGGSVQFGNTGLPIGGNFCEECLRNGDTLETIVTKLQVKFDSVLKFENMDKIHFLSLQGILAKGALFAVPNNENWKTGQITRCLHFVCSILQTKIETCDKEMKRASKDALKSAEIVQLLFNKELMISLNPALQAVYNQDCKDSREEDDSSNYKLLDHKALLPLIERFKDYESFESALKDKGVVLSEASLSLMKKVINARNAQFEVVPSVMTLSYLSTCRNLFGSNFRILCSSDEGPLFDANGNCVGFAKPNANFGVAISLLDATHRDTRLNLEIIGQMSNMFNSVVLHS